MSLRHPFSLILAGPSRAGKSHFVRKLLASDLIHGNIEQILWLSGSEDVSMPTNVRHVDSFDALEANLNGLSTLIVMDDVGDDACSDQRVCNLFTKRSHHENISVVMILQNLFTPGKYSRSITQNSEYLIFFKNPRDGAIIDSLSRFV